MTDQNVGNPNPETNQEGETTQEGAVKLFTQEQLDQIINSRLEREKLKQSTDIELVKTQAEKASSDLEAANTLNQSYEKIIAGMIKDRMKALPKSTRQLLEKLSVADQLEWLEANKDELEQSSVVTKTIKSTPTPNTNVKVDMEKILEGKREKSYGPSF